MSAVAETPAAPVAPATPGPRAVEPGPSAKFDSLDDALAPHAGLEPPPKREAPAKPDKPASPTPPKTEANKPDAPAKPADAKAAETTATTAKPEKWNPVKEVKELRPKIAALEAENKRLRESIVPEQERGTLTQRMEAIQKENEELRNKIRYKDYESSSEFVDKYHTPYVKAISSAMRDLQSIPITDAATGQQRAATEADLFEVVNRLGNLPEARKFAKAMVGEDPEIAQDIVEMAKKVREVGLARAEALDNERKNGATRVQQTTEQETRLRNQIAKENDDLWKQENEALINNPKDPELAEILKPKVAPEGQQLTPEEVEHNTALEKGYKLVDEAFKTVGEVRNKGSQATKEERAALSRKLAAVRHRAAGFGIARRQMRALKAKLSAAESELASYKGTTPANGGRQSARSTKPAAQSSDDIIMEGLNRYASR